MSHQTSEELRDLLDKYFQQIGDLNLNGYTPHQALEQFAKDQGLTVNVIEDNHQIYTILWDMVMQQIIQPTISSVSGASSPVIITGFHLTEWGEKALQGLPVDRPNQYLDHLKAEVPGIDTEILDYVRESLTCYNVGCYLASSVMLGAASEKLFTLLLEAYTDAIADVSKREKFRKSIDGVSVSRQYNEFEKKLPDLTGKNGALPKDLKVDFDHYIQVIFILIRLYRNYAGHPGGKTIPRHIVLADLNIFPPYCRHLYKVMEWFHNNPI